MEEGIQTAKAWAQSSNKLVILQRLQGLDLCIDSFENQLEKLNEDLKNMKLLRTHIVHDAVTLGLSVEGVQMTEKDNLPSKGVQMGLEQVNIDDKTIQQIEETRAVESILEDHKYNKAMKLMPEPLKQMNFSHEINMKICEKIKENPMKNIIVNMIGNEEITTFLASGLSKKCMKTTCFS